MANVYRVLHRPCLPRVFAHAGTSASSPLLSGSTLAVLASAVEPRPLKRNVRGLALPQSVAVDSEAVAGPGSLETCKSIIMDPVADRKDRLKAVLQYAKLHADLADEDKTLANRVMGCTAQTPEQLQEASSGDFEFLEWGMGAGVASRVNPTANLLEAMKKRAAGLQGELPRFPSLLISADGLIPQGPFAEAQAQYLRPAPAQVAQLVQLLKEKKIGVVAHFYMDPEVQGVLAAAGEEWPHIHISDSLLMADSAVGMARAGCSAVLVLGVDFMSENVRAILDEAGHSDVQVYRMAEQDIGCSLAEAAEADTYFMYLGEAVRRGVPALHVVYINTSLRTKALAHSLVPTITCTSSNVVQTVLQAFAQIPDVEVYYGPDTYMGRNLAHLLTSLSSCSDAEVQEIHPQHTAASIRAALPRLHYYEEGTCIVHHMFGGEVTHLVRTAYGDAYLAAHFEVPGEMFALAMKARQERGMGVVGSTSNILDFIASKVTDAVQRPFPEHIQVVLGTESGMITSIVRKVQSMLQEAKRPDIQVEVVFPVAREAITTPKQAVPGGPVSLPGGLALVPGPASGEGCSQEGGCAACPYMKMNSLSALLEVCARVGTPGECLLEGYKPKAYADLVNGQTMAAVGCHPILHMRGFQTSKKLPPALEAEIIAFPKQPA